MHLSIWRSERRADSRTAAPWRWLVSVMRWLLILVGAVITAVVVHAAVIVGLIWRLQAINLW
jgi:hypothetical protein